MPKKNLERAGWAAKCLELFGKLTGCHPKDEGWETAMSDFVADLRHLCDREGVAIENVLDRSLDHYMAESRCCECENPLKAGDDAEGVDCVCKACEAKIAKG